MAVLLLLAAERCHTVHSDAGLGRKASRSAHKAKGWLDTHVHICPSLSLPDTSQGNIGLRFQHPAPVQPGALGNIGWREEENLARQGQDAAAAGAAAAAVVAPAKAAAAADGSLGMYTMEEVEQHATEESAWFVHEGKVSKQSARGLGLVAQGVCSRVLCSPTSPAQCATGAFESFCARAGRSPVARPDTALASSCHCLTD